MSPIVLLLALASSSLAGSWQHHRLTVLDEAMALPATSLVSTPIHPGLMVGTSPWSSGGERLEHRLQLDGGVYLHAPLEHALFLLPSWQETCWPTRPLGLSLLGGVGAKLALPASPRWTKQDGEWRSSTRLHPELTAQLGLGLDLRVHERWTVILQHRGALDAPFSPELAPAMFHRTTHLGLEYHP